MCEEQSKLGRHAVCDMSLTILNQRESTDAAPVLAKASFPSLGDNITFTVSKREGVCVGVRGGENVCVCPYRGGRTG